MCPFFFLSKNPTHPLCSKTDNILISCLDDTELDFLGVPWPQYEECASSNGLDVLRLAFSCLATRLFDKFTSRIPTPEGLAPLTPAFLETYLTDLINTYTLQGVPVLVHCRGGVGRAGVIACCWLIKLGLCGWVEGEGKLASGTPPSPSLSDSPADMTIFPCSDPFGLPPVADTVKFVERIIAVVRKRRSLKAVETYEQVRFLVDFVDHLRDRSGTPQL